MKNMNKLLASFGFVIILVFMIFAFASENKQMNLDQERYRVCVSEMQKAIPDPNDTNSRSVFLENCQK